VGLRPNVNAGTATRRQRHQQRASDDHREYRYHFGFSIEPHKPLCETGGELALVGAFMACFDRYDDGRPWGRGDWDFLLTDIRCRLRTGGRLAIKFNADMDTGELYTREVRRLFSSRPDYRCRILLDYVLLTAR
jgi:hypothetical protein